MNDPQGEELLFGMAVLGRTLEHLGVQMYKQRPAAIAELVMNAWDAGASRVDIFLPKKGEYDRTQSTITIRDDGLGMAEPQVRDEYLVVGRNRRLGSDGQATGDVTPVSGGSPRQAAGRKGIGKLAAFGVASKMSVTTWRDGHVIEFALDAEAFARDDQTVTSLAIPGTRRPLAENWAHGPHGTQIVLRDLRHSSELEHNALSESLARRFAREVRNDMEITVNGQRIDGPTHVVDAEQDDQEVVLADGERLVFRYRITNTPIRSVEQRGFAVYARGKVAQSGGFHFGAEGGTGQHYYQYYTGDIIADFIDAGTDSQSDIISTDRQEIDWDSERVRALHDWGRSQVIDIVAQIADLRKAAVTKFVLHDVEEFRERIEALETPSRNSIKRVLGSLGGLSLPEDATDDDKREHPTYELANQLIRAYEFKNFHDVTKELEAAADDPPRLVSLLEKLRDWKTLESRALLELIKGRIEIADRFHSMLVNDAPEVSTANDSDSMHELLASMPWLLNPDWQLFQDERAISTQLREWGCEENTDLTEAECRARYDFLALGADERLAIVEIKRPGHVANTDDLDQLLRYMRLLKRAHPNISGLFVHGGETSWSADEFDWYQRRDDLQIATWEGIYQAVTGHYARYRDVLEGNANTHSFAFSVVELQRMRRVRERGTVRRRLDERNEWSPDPTLDGVSTDSEE